MRYTVELKPRALKDLRHMPKPEAARALRAIEQLGDNLAGDVKRLTHFTPEYRLRIGDYRALFAVEARDRVVIYRVRH
jgi:mRNA interferase RelE/StbE